MDIKPVEKYAMMTAAGAKEVGNVELAGEWVKVFKQPCPFDFDNDGNCHSHPDGCPEFWSLAGGSGELLIREKDFLLSPFPEEFFSQAWWHDGYSKNEYNFISWSMDADGVWLVCDEEMRPVGDEWRLLGGESVGWASWGWVKGVADWPADRPWQDSLFDRRWATAVSEVSR